MRSFIDFYNKHSIIPVFQTIADQKAFIAKRIYLLNSLGVPSLLLPHISFCEFGPGTGQNTSALISEGLNDLTLVEGSESAISLLHRLREESRDNVDRFEIFFSTFSDFSPTRSYDIVWAEGCIPHQFDPVEVASKISSHVARNGLLVISTISGLSHLSETLRRIISSIYLDKPHPDFDDLDSLIELFEPDLCLLPSRSRPVRDWVLDVIIQPLHYSKLFSQVDALNSLGDSFLYYHSLPSFLSPYYWYKEYSPASCSSILMRRYYETNMCLVSNELIATIHSSSDGETAELLGSKLWDLASSYQQGLAQLDDILFILQELTKTYDADFSGFASRLEAICAFLARFSSCKDEPVPLAMQGFWGRGQQYISLVRR